MTDQPNYWTPFTDSLPDVGRKIEVMGYKLQGKKWPDGTTVTLENESQQQGAGAVWEKWRYKEDVK
jgi:hypothetical protein